MAEEGEEGTKKAEWSGDFTTKPRKREGAKGNGKSGQDLRAAPHWPLQRGREKASRVDEVL